MSTPSKRPDRPSDDKAKAPAPALKLSSRCPNCGRAGVVLFTVPPPADAPEDTARVVCLDCCPKTPDKS